MSIDQALDILITEIKGLRADLKKSPLDHCDTKEALLILGLNNYRLLTHFANEGFLTRRRGGKGFVYYKSDLNALAEKIRNKEIIVPKNLYK